jgi:hypothetical protein
MPVGMAMMEVDDVKYALESISNPTANIWWPQTTHPNKPIKNNAITMLSLPNIMNCVNLDIILLTSPKPGKMRIYTSGWPKNQNKC